MARVIEIDSYLVRIATCSQGFNLWRQNIIVRTTDTSTYCDLRFVDDPSVVQPSEQVRENGPSYVYLPSVQFESTLHLLQSEKPLFMVLYESVNCAMIQTGQEPPGEQEG